MAQARVTEYYSAKKRRKAEQPSKRRKVDFTQTEPSLSLESAKLTSKNVPNILQAELSNSKSVDVNNIRPTTTHSVSPAVTRSGRRTGKSAKSTVSIKSVTRRSARTKHVQENTIPELFQRIADSPQLQVVKEPILQTYAEATDSWDEHNCSITSTPECTPMKPNNQETNIRRKRKKVLEIQAKELLATPTRELPATDENDSSQVVNKHTSVKKKLVLNSKNNANSKNIMAPEQVESSIENVQPEEANESPVVPASKDQLVALAAAMSPPKAISPLPTTPVQTERSIRSKKVPAQPSSKKILAAIEQCKALTSKTKGSASPKGQPLIDPSVVKARLAKCGKLDELKAQLSKMNEGKTKSKKKTPVVKALEPDVTSPKLDKFDSLNIERASKNKQTVEKVKVPAYERYHHLVSPAAPTLSLPYKYRILAEMFRGMDTIISMLHNRSEIITFSKLKVAVQEMNKRNFEEKHVGKVKTVHPSAYIFRQEKGLPCFGGKTTGYELTVEPNLQSDLDTGSSVDCPESSGLSGARVNFSASHLLRRRGGFHNRLIAIVKRYHKEFLSKLATPLSIPDDKITRWHPQFKLDEVPDVDPSPLPQPPYEKKYHSAKDVLEATRGKTLPRVEKALENVAAKSSANINSPVKPVSSTKMTPVKGIPQGLLEKIRAKENAKLEAALTRNPADEKKTFMMSRLPDMMRIVRNYYVTEKKSTLPMDIVVQKLQDSYRSTIALSDMESHVKLMIELVPNWISLQQIRKGRYLKLNIKMELHTLQDQIKNMVKARK